MTPPRDVDRILDKLDKQDNVLTQVQTTQATLVEKAEDAARSRQRIYQKTEEIETQVRHVEARVADVEYRVGEVSQTCGVIDKRVGLIETWRQAQDRRADEQAGERRGLDRIRGHVWATISGLAMLIGGGIAALAIELVKRFL